MESFYTCHASAAGNTGTDFSATSECTHKSIAVWIYIDGIRVVLEYLIWLIHAMNIMEYLLNGIMDQHHSLCDKSSDEACDDITLIEATRL